MRRFPQHSLALVAAATTVLLILAAPAAGAGGVPAATASPTISGSPVVGATLTASTGSWTAGPTGYAFAWSRCSGGSCTSTGTGQTHTLGTGDVGSTIRVTVTATNKKGSGSASASAGPVTGGTTPPTTAPPSATAAPTVGGTLMSGATLTATTGTWSGSPTSYSYTWLRCDSTGAGCSPLTPGGGSAYLLGLLDVGATMRVSVTATNSGGSSSSTSNASGVIAPPPAPSPVVSIAAPTSGATVAGSVPFTASVSNATASRVDFTIDGGGLFSEYQAPYVYNGDGNTLDTTKLANGSHSLAARAYFADGSSIASSIQVNVQNTVQTSPTTTSNGIGVMRFGSSFTQGSNYNRYNSVFVGYGDVDAAAALTARSLVYKGGVDVTDSPNTDPGQNIAGVGYKQALANGWLLKDSAGNLIRSPAGSWFGDVGDANYQKAWVSNVSTWLLAHSADGVFIDNVLCAFGGLSNGVLPAKYLTDSAWANAQTAFVAYVGPAMAAKGLYVAVNAYCYGPDNGSANTAWWTRIAPYVDGLMTEDFEQNPGNMSQLFYNAPTVSWLGNWLGKLDVIKAAQTAGKDAFALSYGASTDTRLMAYTKASYLMAWDG
jgi:hypothetical protein